MSDRIIIRSLINMYESEHLDLGLGFSIIISPTIFDHSQIHTRVRRSLCEKNLSQQNLLVYQIINYRITITSNIYESENLHLKSMY